MTQLLSSQSTEFISSVVLPLLQVVVAAFALLVLVFTLRWSARTLTRSVTPQIECYLRLGESKPVFNFVIANFGSGSAYSVSFRLDADEDDFSEHRVFMRQRSTDVPFPIIEPGGRITTFFGAGLHLLGSDPPLKPFKATVTYEWQPFWSKRRRREERHYDMDIRPFSGIVPDWEKDEVAEVLKSGLSKITRAVETIRRPPVPADRRSSGNDFFRRIESLMPGLFVEMRKDLKSSPMKREFILQPKMALYNSGQKALLAYCYEDHDDLADKVGLLVNEGVVTDITYNNIDRYVMSEALVEYLEGSAAADQEGQRSLP